MASIRRPRVLAIYNSKGGVGKTTLAVHLAVAAEQAGERVAIADTDEQGSAATWGRARTGSGTATPMVVSVRPAQLNALLDAAATDDISLLIVDTAPHAAPGSATAIEHADLVIVPTRPSAFDLAAVGKAVAVVRAAGKPAMFVLNGCPPRATAEIQEAREALEGYEFPVAAMELVDRRAFARAVATGRAVTEFEARGRAAGEIQALWAHIKEILNGKQARRAG